MHTSRKLTVCRDGHPCYDILYSHDLNHLTEALQQLGLLEHKILIVTDSNVGPLYADQVAAACGGAPVYMLPAGEENKNLQQIQNIYRYLIENRYDRKSCLIALGGGVVGDMTGFAAATYLRGIRFVQIPTTLLAQADSSIGGKTGVDFEGYKNMVGAFHMPRLVFADTDFLQTLDGRQFSSGFAEIMKHGLIRDEAYYVWLIEHMEQIMDRDPETLTQMLYRSNEIKKEIVEEDPYENGSRTLLNFGHTIGHAIEKYENFTFTHGECVALGCIAAAFISYKRGLLSWEEYYEIRDMFVPFGLPISLAQIDAQRVLSLTKSDKKAADGRIRFVLLKGIGNAFTDMTVTDDEMISAIEELDFSRKTGEYAK